MSRIDIRGSDEYRDYMRDESRTVGSAEAISFPRSEREISLALSAAWEEGMSVTLQGARTGITAGAVPHGGSVLNMSRMNRVTALRRGRNERELVATVLPGMPLAELNRCLESGDFDVSGWSPDSLACLEALRAAGSWFFPPDPTETSAAIGGMVATNASGARSFKYGPVRNHVCRVRGVLSDGNAFELRRDGLKADGRRFCFDAANGRTVSGVLPSYRMPSVKNAAGYFVRENMDLLDLLIGSEGTLCAFSEIDVRVVPAPARVLGIAAFFDNQDSALDLAESLRADPAAAPAAIEFFDHGSLALLAREKKENEAFAGLRSTDPEWKAAIYAEFHARTDDELDARMLSAAEAVANCGGNDNAAWVADNPAKLRELKEFRHAVPEAVNLAIDRIKLAHPEIKKLGTDMATPDDRFREMMATYRAGLCDNALDSVIFGHIGNNHLHVNIIPRNPDEYRRGAGLYREWAGRVSAMGGTVSAEHGVGKLKRDLLLAMYGEAGVAEMRAVKRAFDPKELLSPGNLFPP